MAVTYGFYDSLNHDRLYNAKQMSAIFDGIINDGVFMSVGNQLHTVAGTGMQVIVKSGRAWFDSTWTLNDAEYPLSIDAADVLLTRIDAVVLEVNSEVATRANTIKVVKGTPASTPAKPTLTNTAAVHQHALAYVTVAKNTTAITNSMIEIVVGKTETPYVTAILQTTDITDLFNKWENDFQVWFETVRSTLDGDIALNLQNQIDALTRSILKDDTKTAMGLPTTAVGDDAFNYLLNKTKKNKKEYQIVDAFVSPSYIDNIYVVEPTCKVFGSNLITLYFSFEDSSVSTNQTYTVSIYDLINKNFKYNETFSGNFNKNSNIFMCIDYSTGDFIICVRQNSSYYYNTDTYLYFVYDENTDKYTLTKQGTFPSIDYLSNVIGLIKGTLLLLAGRNYSVLRMYRISTNSVVESNLNLFIQGPVNPTDIANYLIKTLFWYNPKANNTILLASRGTSSSTLEAYKIDYDNLSITKIGTKSYTTANYFDILYASIDHYIYGIGYASDSPYDILFTCIDVDTETVTQVKIWEGTNSTTRYSYGVIPLEYTTKYLKIYCTVPNTTLYIVMDVSDKPKVTSIEDIKRFISSANSGFRPTTRLDPSYKSIMVDNRVFLNSKYSKYVYMQAGGSISTSTSYSMKSIKCIINRETNDIANFNDLVVYGVNELVVTPQEDPVMYYIDSGIVYKYLPMLYMLGGE